MVALPDENTRRVMGYYVADTPSNVLYWLYVKEPFRRLGIGRALLEHAAPFGEPWTYVYRTRMSQGFLGDRFRWDPTPARVK